MIRAPGDRMLVILKSLLARSTALGAALVLMLGLTACGGGGGGGGSTTPPPTVTLSSIAMSPASATLAVAGTQQLTVTGNYSDGSTKNLTSSASYTSSATGIATVSASGDVTATAPGSATITASDGGYTATTMITVDAAAPTLSSIAVAPPSVTLAIGATQPLTVTGTYTDQSTKNLTSSSAYQSSATSIATVTSPGAVVTAVAAGSATITVTNSGKTATVAVTVSPPPTLTSITLAAPSQTVNLGDTLGLVVTGHYSDGSTRTLTSGETYTSGSAQVATVNAGTGVVTPVGFGSSTMTATDTASGLMATYVVTVLAGADSGYVFYNDYAPGVTYQDGSSPALVPVVDTTTTNNGRASLKFVIPGTPSVQGVLVNATAQNLSGFNALSFWAKVDNAPPSGVSALGIGGLGGFGPASNTATLAAQVTGLTVNSTWTKYLIPLPDPAMATSLAPLFSLVEVGSGYTLWLSDIQYVSLSSGIAPTLANATLNGDPLAVPETAPAGGQVQLPSGGYVPYTQPALPNGELAYVGLGWYALNTSACANIATVSAAWLLTVSGAAASGQTCTITGTLQGVTVQGGYQLTVQ